MASLGDVGRELVNLWEKEPGLKGAPMWQRVMTLPAALVHKYARDFTRSLKGQMDLAKTGQLDIEQMLGLSASGLMAGAPGGAPFGAKSTLGSVNTKFLKRLEREMTPDILNHTEKGVYFRRVKDLPDGLSKFVDTEEAMKRMTNFDPDAILAVSKAGPAAESTKKYYRPAVRVEGGEVLHYPFAKIHEMVLSAQRERLGNRKVVDTGALDPEGNYWVFSDFGDIKSEYRRLDDLLRQYQGKEPFKAVRRELELEGLSDKEISKYFVDELSKKLNLRYEGYTPGYPGMKMKGIHQFTELGKGSTLATESLDPVDILSMYERFQKDWKIGPFKETRLYTGASSKISSSTELPEGHRGYFSTEDLEIAKRYGENVYEVIPKTKEIFEGSRKEHQDLFIEAYKKLRNVGDENFIREQLARGAYPLYEDHLATLALKELGFKGNWQTEAGAKVLRLFDKKDFDIKTGDFSK